MFYCSCANSINDADNEGVNRLENYQNSSRWFQGRHHWRGL